MSDLDLERSETERIARFVSEVQAEADLRLARRAFLEEQDLSFVGTCQRCGRYLDVRQHKRCPAPCDGYIG